MMILISFFLAMAPAVFGASAPPPPGVVIDHVPQTSGMYVGSPSIAILGNGRYIATHDLFGPQSGFQREGITRVFESKDRGRSWTHLTDIHGQFWSTVFVHRNALYLIGVHHQYGDMVIRKSLDGGRGWTEPRDGATGVLRRGRFHCAPQPVLLHDGRIWRAMEDAEGGGGWGAHFRAFVMSAPVDADLLNAASWISTEPLGRDASWLDGKFQGWLEGNAVAGPGKRVLDVLRVAYYPGDKVAAITISDDGKTAAFDPRTGFLDLPGGATKFTIRFDPKSRLYWTLVNWPAPGDRTQEAASIRNTLALARSADLRTWEVRSIVLHHPDVKHHAFQYVDWVFDRDDLAFVSRTAWDDDAGGAHSFHDANFMTFHRVRNFRKVGPGDSVVPMETLR